MIKLGFAVTAYTSQGKVILEVQENGGHAELALSIWKATYPDGIFGVEPILGIFSVSQKSEKDKLIDLMDMINHMPRPRKEQE